MIPGELLIAAGDIELNADRARVVLTVANTGDRPIQVGSHYHFFETNEALQFERERTLGYRLNIAAGTAVRFEPGQTRRVELVALAGDRRVFGFAGRVMGELALADVGRVCAAPPRSPATAEDVKSAGERGEAAYTRPTSKP